MKEEMLFFLLEKPRSVSDMIRQLTDKELSSSAERRSEQIPRIAGNWFKDGGYLASLLEEGQVRDVGRAYAIRRDWLAEAFLRQLGVPAVFPAIEERGDAAPINDAYGSFIPEYTWGDLRQQLQSTVFGGEVMADLFSFGVWGDVLCVPEPDDRRIGRVRLSFDFWGAIHYVLLSSIFRYRYTNLGGLMEDRSAYFEWRSRRQQLVATRGVFRRKLVRQRFPGVEPDSDGVYRDDHVEAVASTFGEAPPAVDGDAAELLAQVYLMGLQDGVDLFHQYSRYDHDINLLFNLLEQGWLVSERSLERDPRTGDFVLPLGQMHAYLDSLVSLVRRNPALPAEL